MPIISADLELVLVLGGDNAVVVPTTLEYDIDTPYAVSAVFRTSDGDVVWIFGRELLDEGMYAPSGEGDVTVWPATSYDRHVVCLSLASPSGSALLEADPAPLRAFLDATFDLVPPGEESAYLDLDSQLAALLDDDSAPRL
jgi:hypothetical protein